MLGVSVVREYFRPDNIDANTAMSQVSSLAISDLYSCRPEPCCRWLCPSIRRRRFRSRS